MSGRAGNSQASLELSCGCLSQPGSSASITTCSWNNSGSAREASGLRPRVRRREFPNMYS